MIYFNLGLLAISLGLFVVFLWNLFALKRIGLKQELEIYPFVSILIPARNEEENIERCLNSVINQDYPNFEILVYDDRSEDRTYEVVNRVGAGVEKLRLISGDHLPEGWLGKCYACHQLSLEAHGELLLFTDADTEHHPRSLKASVRTLKEERGGLLTLITQIKMGSLWERLCLPMLHFMEFLFLPFGLVTQLKTPSLSMGNGQFMLFEKAVYEEIGGHLAVRDQLVEDVWLARRVKEIKSKLLIKDGFALVQCRMYQDFSGIFEGFSKNLFPGFNFSLPGIFAFMMLCFFLFVFPYVQIGIGVYKGGDIFIPVIMVGMAIFIRVVLAVRFKLGLISCFVHVFSMILFLVIALNSVRIFVFKRGASWKGRVYLSGVGHKKDLPGAQTAQK